MEPVPSFAAFLPLFLDPFGDRIQPKDQSISQDEVRTLGWVPWRQGQTTSTTVHLKAASLTH